MNSMFFSFEYHFPLFITQFAWQSGKLTNTLGAGSNIFPKPHECPRMQLIKTMPNTAIGEQPREYRHIQRQKLSLLGDIQPNGSSTSQRHNIYIFPTDRSQPITYLSDSTLPSAIRVLCLAGKTDGLTETVCGMICILTSKFLSDCRQVTVKIVDITAAEMWKH